MPEAVSLNHVLQLYSHVCHWLNTVSNTWCDCTENNNTSLDFLLASITRLTHTLQRYASTAHQNVSTSVARRLSHSLHVLYRYTVLLVRMWCSREDDIMFSSTTARLVCRQAAASAWRAVLESVSLSTEGTVSCPQLASNAAIIPPSKYGGFILVCDHILQLLDLKQLKASLESGRGKFSACSLEFHHQLCDRLRPLIDQLVQHTHRVIGCCSRVSQTAGGLEKLPGCSDLPYHQRRLSNSWQLFCRYTEGGSARDQTRVTGQQSQRLDSQHDHHRQQHDWEKFLCVVQQLRDAVEATETACNTALLRCLLCVFDETIGGDCGGGGGECDAPETILAQLCQLAGDCSADEPQLATVFSCLSVLSELSALYDRRNVVAKQTQATQKHCPLHDQLFLITYLNRVLAGQSQTPDHCTDAGVDPLMLLRLKTADKRIVCDPGVLADSDRCCSWLILQQSELLALRRWLVADLRSALDRIVDPAAFVHVAFCDSSAVTGRVTQLTPSTDKPDQSLLTQFSCVVSVGRRVGSFLNTLTEPPAHTALSQFVLPDVVLRLTADLCTVIGRSLQLPSIACGTNELANPSAVHLIGCMKAIVTYLKRIAAQLSTVGADMTGDCDETDALLSPFVPPDVERSPPIPIVAASGKTTAVCDTPGRGNLSANRTRCVSFARTPYRKVRRA